MQHGAFAGLPPSAAALTLFARPPGRRTSGLPALFVCGSPRSEALLPQAESLWLQAVREATARGRRGPASHAGPDTPARRAAPASRAAPPSSASSATASGTAPPSAARQAAVGRPRQASVPSSTARQAQPRKLPPLPPPADADEEDDITGQL
jgi:hypothetical protein